ncbi:beta-Ig-H3/fasciclin [Zymoseptoria tritici IPO323]|uniref:Beta-Ig-H3/fasciclin n=1 Tax=Zymoseptoria tritici (strain CBS 115943 / IPO323) TaxID=336722 RepID=F9XNP6_ZYMTI|nr:beta-Ig-H3/fasciclin [Zymoseptoria tritici IPO323]EGP82909.1 beta-Ig-H3/fasciclin [Zymoseptoria tritici IPO323]
MDRSSPATDQLSNSALQALRSHEDLAAFVHDVEAVPEITNVILAHRDITIMAPVNSAWLRVDATKRRNPAFLAWHIMNANVLTSDVPLVQYEQHPGITIPTFLSGSKNWTYSGEPASLNISYDRGIIHKIDPALQFPTSAYETAFAVGLYSYCWAVFTAGLDQEIRRIPNSTFLLPINEAFHAALPFLLGATREEFKRIVYRHVIPGRVLWSHEFSNASHETVEGSTVQIRGGNGPTWFVDDAMILDGSDKPLYNGLLAMRCSPIFDLVKVSTLVDLLKFGLWSHRDLIPANCDWDKVTMAGNDLPQVVYRHVSAACATRELRLTQTMV